MIEFEFLINKNKEMHMHADIELLYVMEGQLDFILEDKQYRLGKEDFFIINVDKRHAYSAKNDILLASLHISYAELSKMLKQDMIFFWCSTVLEENEMYEVIRGIIKKIVSEQFQNKGIDEIYMNYLYYEFLHVLTHDFMLNRDNKYFAAEAHKFDDRKHKIADYIRLNYDKPISLQDMAKRMFLSNAYLSKYIKRQFGMSFIDYVNSIRLNYAVSQLLYSDKSVIRIAMDTGFASSAALNKAFKEKYNMTPTIYRSQWKNIEGKSRNTVEDENIIQKQVARYFENNKQEKQLDGKIYEEIIILNNTQKTVINKSWNKMINIGSAADLLHSDMQQHILQLKKELHFQYIRFWDIYSSEIFLDVHKKGKNYNFDKLDRILDFLMEHDIFPFIELGIKPKKVIQNRRKMLIQKDSLNLFEDDDTICHFHASMLGHLITRYGAEKVEKWYFELWKPEKEEDLVKSYILNKTELNQAYLQKFDLIAGTLRDLLPTIQIGGGGLSLRYGEEAFRELLRSWKDFENQPDFISVYSYPYSIDSIDKEKNQSTDREYLKNNLIKVREMMKETQFGDLELYVTEWNFTISNRNILNDNCMKAAYLVKNMIDSIGFVDVLGYWTGSDLFADYYDSKLLLNGGNGILSKDGIPKPAYYAFEFMNNLGKYARKAGKHYLVTDNGHGNWRIVCHNLKDLNYQYGLRMEDEINLNDQNILFSDIKKTRLHFELPVPKNGSYQIRIYLVNQKNGSVQDEWISMSSPKQVGQEDIAYLKRITTPRMVIMNIEVTNFQLVFDTTLEANEIQFIHTAYQFL